MLLDMALNYVSYGFFISAHTKSIRKLFDPLVAEDKSVATAEDLCKAFLKRLRKLKVAHTTRRSGLRKVLTSVKNYVSDLLTQFES